MVTRSRDSPGRAGLCDAADKMELRDNRQEEVGVDWVESFRIRGGVDLMPIQDDLLGEAFFFLIKSRKESCGGKPTDTLLDLNSQGEILYFFWPRYFSGRGASIFFGHTMPDFILHH